MAMGEAAKCFLPGSPTCLLLKPIFIWSLPSARRSSRIPQTLPSFPPLSHRDFSTPHTASQAPSQISFRTPPSTNATNLRPFQSQQTLLSNQWPLTAKSHSTRPFSIPQPVLNPPPITSPEPPSPEASSSATFICLPPLSLQHPTPSICIPVPPCSFHLPKQPLSSAHFQSLSPLQPHSPSVSILSSDSLER